MHHIIWEYRVAAGNTDVFEAFYAAGGAWTELFSRDPGYLGTEFLKDAGDPGRYLTIDRWLSASSYESFRLRFRAEYEELDTRCWQLTTHESQIGDFNSVDPGG